MSRTARPLSGARSDKYITQAQHNHIYTNNNTFRCTIGPWIACFVCMSLLHITYGPPAQRNLGRGDDTVGNPHGAQFELFELILLFKFDKQFPVEQFEATVSQSAVPSPLLGIQGVSGMSRCVGRMRSRPQIAFVGSLSAHLAQPTLDQEPSKGMLTQPQDICLGLHRKVPSTRDDVLATTSLIGSAVVIDTSAVSHSTCVSCAAVVHAET